MSFENKNLYALLGNDVEDDTPTPLPREIVKNTTSSKKADVPPPSADPAKAKKKSKVTGNEGALKSKPNNKSVSGPSSTPSKHQKRPFDRHSRTGKTDSKKQVKQGWGDEKEVVESDDAEETELADGGEQGEPSTPKKSLQEYFAELQVKQQELTGERKVRQANEGAEAKWTAADKIQKEVEEYVSPSIAKKQKNKSQKEKKFLDINAVFADEKQPRQQESKRGGFKGAKRGGAKRGGLNTKKPVVNDKNFPSL